MTEAAAAPTDTGEEGGTSETEATNQDTASADTQETDKEVSDWRAQITEPDLAKFIKNYNTPADLAKSALNFRQKLSNAISLPGKDSSDEDKAEFFKKLGVPESVEGYDYKLPEIPEEISQEDLTPSLDVIKESLHKSGATQETAKATLDTVVDLLVKSQQEAATVWKKNVEDSETKLRQEWLGDYDTNMTYSKRAQEQFLSDEVLSLMKETEVGGIALANHPDMAKMFADIGRKMGEGGLQYVATEADSQSFNEKQDELTQKAMDAQSSGDRIAAEKLFAQRDKLAKQFYGET